jgi:hypothetical protein
MTEIYKALYLSPMVPSYNVAETKRFFVDLFGFTPVMEGSYSIVKKDAFLIHILNAGENIGEMEFYLEVSNIDDLWLSVHQRITGYTYRPPFDREYGMREFHIVVPYTETLMFVGMVIP